MALFARKSRTEDASEPARLLINDHIKVERIFDEIKEADSPNRRTSLLIQLDAELTRHTTIEENILYPFIEDQLPDGPELIDEAEKEHEEASKLLEKVANLDPSAPDFMSDLKALEKAVSHHVEEEEHGLFPKLEEATDEATLARLRLELENEKLGMTPSPTLPSGSGEVRGGTAKPRAGRSAPRTCGSSPIPRTTAGRSSVRGPPAPHACSTPSGRPRSSPAPSPSASGSSW